MSEALEPLENQTFLLIQTDLLTFDAPAEIAAMFKLSPFVWKEGERFRLLLRVVNDDENPAKKMARIYSGLSDDGLHFVLDETPVIEPGPDETDSLDSSGCEDPSVAIVDGTYFVYYTSGGYVEGILSFVYPINIEFMS